MPLFKLFLLPILIGFGLPTASIDQQPATPSDRVIGAGSNSQAQELFRYLRCHRQAKNIVVNWGVSSTAGINYFIVYHSEDDDFYDDLTIIPVESSEKYSYKHLSVFPGYHYYKIAAVLTNGTTIYSGVDVVRIVSHG